MLLIFETELLNMNIGLIADFPGPTVALFTNIFFHNRSDDNKLLSVCLLVVSQIYSAMSYYRYLQNVSYQVFYACLCGYSKTRKQFPVQPRTQGTFGNESTLVDRGLRGFALLPRFWAIKQFVIVFFRCSWTEISTS